MVAEASEDDLFSNMSEELRETDIKQSPGTGKTIFFDFSFVINSLRCYYKMLLWTKLCHPKVRMAKPQSPI